LLPALKKAGVESPCTGAHLFRHTLPPKCSIKELRWRISQFAASEFQHHDLYAKVDLTALRPSLNPGQEVTYERFEKP
jgi:hypothetical protein